jgi:hypothetical protein
VRRDSRRISSGAPRTVRARALRGRHDGSDSRRAQRTDYPGMPGNLERRAGVCLAADYPLHTVARQRPRNTTGPWRSQVRNPAGAGQQHALRS